MRRKDRLLSVTKKVPPGFGSPIAQPGNETDKFLWQARNRSWWEANPMRYDWVTPVKYAEFSREFYEEIDRRHFSDAARYLPPRVRPFDELLPFDQLANFDVLEIGVGNGSHAQLIAPFCGTYTGIDITDYAVQSTRRRFEIFGLRGEIQRMDAENLDFPANSLDFIWSWGVIHHSANTEKILREIYRTLRHGGRAVIMVYHRSLFYYYVFNGLFRGIFGGGLLKTRSLHELVQLHTDGAIARFYTVNEWKALTGQLFEIEDIRIKGQKSELFPLPPSGFKDSLMRVLPDGMARLILNNLRQGSFLISTLKKA